MKSPTQSKHLRILLVDDHPVVREGSGLLLAPEGIEVCGEVAGCRDALAVLAKCRSEVAIVDLSLDGEDGVALITDLHPQGARVLVYSMYNDARHVGSAIAAGALGYVTKPKAHPIVFFVFSS
jgi:DNA-binding NarL/FixJ family response regulator